MRINKFFAAVFAVIMTITICAVPISAESKLPNWNLNDIYKSSAEIDRDLASLQYVKLPKLQKLADKVKDVPTFKEWLEYNDETYALTSKIISYATLLYSIDASDADAQRLYNNGQAAASYFGGANVYSMSKFSLLDDTFWKDALSDSSLKKWRGDIQEMLDEKDDALTSEEEELAYYISTAENYFSNIYSTFTNVDMTFNDVTLSDGTVVNANYNNLLKYGATVSTEDMLKLRKAYNNSFGEYGNFFAANMNAFFSTGENLAVSQGYDSVFDLTMENDGISEEDFNALINGFKSKVGSIEKYNGLKKKILGKASIYSFESFNSKISYSPVFSYENGRKIIHNSLAVFGKSYVDTIESAFSDNWIDAAPIDTKSSGAFCAGVLGVHPFILMTYQNDFQSVDTLIHELGHAVNQFRSDKSSIAASERSPSIIVSEVASTGNQFLLYNYMLRRAKTDEEKLFYIMNEIDFIESTSFHQIMFADFERQARKIVEKGDVLNAETLNKLYAKLVKLYSPGAETYDENQYYWASISHFYNDYYVYKYAMSAAAACAITDKITAGDKDAIKNYKKFIAAGSSMDTVELYALIGVDISNTDYINPIIEKHDALVDEASEIWERMQEKAA